MDESELELSLYPKQGVVIDTSIYSDIDKNTIDDKCKNTIDDECKETIDDECKETNENNSGSYSFTVDIYKTSRVDDEDNNIIIKKRYSQSIHPLFYVIIGCIIIVVIAFITM